MKLQNRDIDVINYIEQYGATIEQIADLYFSGSYDAARKRLKLIEKAHKQIKSGLHPTLGKKVYYKTRMPSYHSLMIQQFYILNRDKIDTIKREVKLDKYRVDALIITKNKRVAVLEVDLYNKTKIEKINAVKRYIKVKLQHEPKIYIVNKDNITATRME